MTWYAQNNKLTFSRSKSNKREVIISSVKEFESSKFTKLSFNVFVNLGKNLTLEFLQEELEYLTKVRVVEFCVETSSQDLLLLLKAIQKNSTSKVGSISFDSFIFGCSTKLDLGYLFTYIADKIKPGELIITGKSAYLLDQTKAAMKLAKTKRLAEILFSMRKISFPSIMLPVLCKQVSDVNDISFVLSSLTLIVTDSKSYTFQTLFNLCFVNGLQKLSRVTILDKKNLLHNNLRPFIYVLMKLFDRLQPSKHLNLWLVQVHKFPGIISRYLFNSFLGSTAQVKKALIKLRDHPSENIGAFRQKVDALFNTLELLDRTWKTSAKKANILARK
eukprot:snap_masked-scaffold_12-processed-gene-0.48-mRNA-1 protein AED:1.00 eAED:1.00 QI:0/-1/0/0/-1/1/1/0/331